MIVVDVNFRPNCCTLVKYPSECDQISDKLIFGTRVSWEEDIFAFPFISLKKKRILIDVHLAALDHDTLSAIWKNMMQVLCKTMSCVVLV